MSLSQQVSGYWDRIYHHYNVPITHGNKHYKGPCPLCNKKEKFRLFKDWIISGGYVCTCSSSGSGINLLMNLKNATYKDIAEELTELLDLKNDNRNIAPIVNESDVKTKEFLALPFLKGTQGEEYLKNRGLNLLPKFGVRFSNDQKFYKDIHYPAMYAIATTDNGSIMYYHCTYLENGKKIPKPDSKKMFKVQNSYDSLAVRMFNHGKVLGITEGIETALGCAQRYDMPVWSTLNSVYLKKFKAPKGVENLNIFADNDANGTGLEAAFTCGRSNILLPNDVKQVHIFWPLERGDFNDMDKGHISTKILNWKLNK